MPAATGARLVRTSTRRTVSSSSAVVIGSYYLPANTRLVPTGTFGINSLRTFIYPKVVETAAEIFAAWLLVINSKLVCAWRTPPFWRLRAFFQMLSPDGSPRCGNLFCCRVSETSSDNALQVSLVRGENNESTIAIPHLVTIAVKNIDSLCRLESKFFCELPISSSFGDGVT